MYSRVVKAIFLCLGLFFAQYLVAEELTTDSFGQLQLIVAKAQKASCYVPVSGGLLQELIRANGGSPKFKPQSEAAIKALIEEYDQTENEFCSPVDGIAANERSAIQQSFERAFAQPPLDAQATSYVRSKEVRDWAKSNSEFLTETLPLSAYVTIIRYVSPERYVSATPQDAKNLELMAGGMISPQDLYYIVEALRSEKIRPLLPARFDLPRLRSKAEALQLEAQRLFKMPDALSYQVRVASALKEAQRVLDPKVNVALAPRNSIARDNASKAATRFVNSAAGK